MIRKNLTNRQFNHLLVIALKEEANNGYPTKWLCKCVCGNITTVQTSNLLNNHTKSCGCIRYTAKKSHGHTIGHVFSPEYRAWTNMKSRCSPSHKQYEDYGGRGITICKQWDDFGTFLKDVGLKPEKHLTLDRINNDGNYEPGNVRWITRKEQQNNRRNYRKRRN